MPASNSGTITVPAVLLKRWKVLVPLALAVVGAVVVGLLDFHPAKALTERDTILLGDFVSTTGDAVFDGTLKQALGVQLAQLVLPFRSFMCLSMSSRMGWVGIFSSPVNILSPLNCARAARAYSFAFS